MSKKRPQSNSKPSYSSDESVDSAEEARRLDLKERDEFSDRLKKKDDGKTRKLVEVSSYFVIENIKIDYQLPKFRPPNAKDTKKLPNASSLRMRVVIKLYHNFGSIHVGNI